MFRRTSGGPVSCLKCKKEYKSNYRLYVEDMCNLPSGRIVFEKVSLHLTEADVYAHAAPKHQLVTSKSIRKWATRKAHATEARKKKMHQKVGRALRHGWKPKGRSTSQPPYSPGAPPATQK